MSVINRAASALKYLAGLVPTQSDYGDLHDSTYWKTEGLGETESVIGSFEIVIPAKRTLSRIVVYTQNGAASINLGNTLGEKEHLENEALIIGVPRVFDIDPIFSIAGQSVFLTFVGGGVTIGELKYYIQ